MLNFPKWKIWSIILAFVASVIFSLPNFFPEQTVAAWPDWMPKQRLSLGLDLRGGSHLLLEADIDDVRTNEARRLDRTVRDALKNAGGGGIAYRNMNTDGDGISFQLVNAAQATQAVSAIENAERTGVLGAAKSVDVQVNGSDVRVRPTDSGLARELDSSMAQAVEVIRRRVDALGTREPTIIRQGASRIVVQVPGLADPAGLKALIGKTAKLEFKLVTVGADSTARRAPPGSQILPFASGEGSIVVRRRAIITGDQLVDSQVTYQDGIPAVSFRFDDLGARIFARTTRDNVGRPFAIVLDNHVISAPRINEPILGGSGVISGNFTTQSANDLAIQLRSGRLPVAMKVIEERTVGPDLGADSVRAGAIASIMSVVIVAIFMFMTYGRFGIYANLALVFNVLMILAIMSVTGATLTLPGIAGLVLTIGAAVDANVLINERIREELRRGGKVVSAIEKGYREAGRTIFDANVTNAIAGLAMMSFGSGPVKGFGVVLTIGIVTSVFTAVTVTRLMVARWLWRARPTRIVL